MKTKWKRVMCGLLCAVFLLTLLPAVTPEAEAVSVKTFQLAQAQNLALSNSTDISKLYNQVILKEMKYIEAMKGLKAKIKNKKSFRWTPLLSFKFPEKFNLTEEYEINMKPLSLQVEIGNLKHELANERYNVLADVNKAYISAYILQEKISFYEEMLVSAEEELARNRARLLTGLASQDDIDTMEKSVETLTGDLAQLKRNFETAKSELTDLCKLDVTSGYVLKNPLKGFAADRDDLDALIEYTLANDHAFYVTKMATNEALTAMDTYESLMKNQYGGKMNDVISYVNMVRNGQDIDYAAFKITYDNMLTAVDKPWSFKIRILFFTFTMEWFKGEISGTRYVEDEMYALYTACQDYDAARKDQVSAEKALRKEVTSSFEAIVTAKNAYLALASALEDAREQLDKVTALNKLGKAEYSEVKDAQQGYQDTQLEALDALATYNELLMEFDRLTCGAITKLMNGESLDLAAGQGGDSFADIEQIDVPYYYIETEIDNMVFQFGVDIPDGYEPELTHFEIWYDGVQLGERTPVSKQLRHLTLDYGEDYSLTVRLFNEDDFVAETVIDTTITRDVLDLGDAVKKTEAEPRKIGNYSVETTAVGGLSTSTLRLSIDPGHDIAYYSLSYLDAGSIYTTEPRELMESFHYLTLLIASLEDVDLLLYDSNNRLLYTGWFDTGTQQVMIPAETDA